MCTGNNTRRDVTQQSQKHGVHTKTTLRGPRQHDDSVRHVTVHMEIVSAEKRRSDAQGHGDAHQLRLCGHPFPPDVPATHSTAKKEIISPNAKNDRVTTRFKCGAVTT